jgi:hypothetical protein
MKGLLAGGSTAPHISTYSSAPVAAAIRMPIPRVSAIPMPSRPAMNSQSAHATPAMEW